MPLKTVNKTQTFVTLIEQVPFFFAMSDNAQARFGFVNFAETWNGRLAMLGFVIGLGTELLTGQGILTQIGLG
ncbi:MAG: hypothetical protein RLZZ216_2210 [Cyanobacteriota bacterium]